MGVAPASLYYFFTCTWAWNKGVDTCIIKLVSGILAPAAGHTTLSSAPTLAAIILVSGILAPAAGYATMNSAPTLAAARATIRTAAV